MDVLDLARWQFGIVTVYHFIFVPLTIGLAPMVAIMQTAWVRTGDEKWLKLTKFFGKLFLINFALGVVTGIVQEFQFGMTWSEYSRFVGDVFGAPLAIEALAAFFIESTFIGLWIFGWDKLPKKIHLAMIWCVAVAVNLSALFILAANSWMQHPVGTTLNQDSITGAPRAEMTDFLAVLTNSTLWAAFPHTVTAAFVTAGTFVAGICAWWMVKLLRSKKAEDAVIAKTVYRSGLRFGAIFLLIAGVGLLASGDYQAKLMFQQQPMKMAAAEALCETETGAAFSVLSIGDLNNHCESVTRLISIPGLTSFLADGTFNSEIKGVHDLQDLAVQKYTDSAAGGEKVNYVPNLAITYWSFRLMIGMGAGSALFGALALWLTRKGRVTDSKWFSRLGLVSIPMIFAGSSFGWIFTEMGRQPWVVVPNPTGVDGVWMLTQRGVSPIAPGLVLASMIAFTVLYTVLAIVWYKLMHRYTIEGAPEHVEDVSPATIGGPRPGTDPDDDDAPLSFAY